MLAFVILLQIALLAALFFFLLRAVKFAASAASDAPFVPTPPAFAQAVLHALEATDGDVVYDLGSGDGRLLLRCAKLLPGARFVGIEQSRTLHLIALLRKLLAGNPRNMRFQRGDLFASDFSGATKIYAYLLASNLARLEPLLARDFRGRLVSRAFSFKEREPVSGVRLHMREGGHNQHILYVYDF
ncbi:MAG: class I SAM-dependent methyltransferase [Candidatus Kaiserbacteria bacterium]|nr:MAG: class I SAM-dependent methyltransferase [Candidatus Kaiserbacteria bacterium]